MTLTPRDRKILAVLGVLVLVAAYWFVALNPKRQEAREAQEALTQAEDRRDAAVAQVRTLEAARTSFREDYATVVRLGKAVPSSVDMPSLLVQLDSAARGTGISFASIKAGERTAAAPAPASSTRPAEPGGTPAQSAPGQAGEAAGNKVADANSSSAQGAAQSGTPQPGAASGAAPGASGETSGVPGLESVPLEFTFRGSFFELADFFHRLKRFVRVANERVLVRGRLLTIDGLKFTSDQMSFRRLTAEVKGTVYLTPKAQGAAAGASPSGPAQAQPASGSPPAASGGSATAPTGSPATSGSPPAAAATP